MTETERQNNSRESVAARFTGSLGSFCAVILLIAGCMLFASPAVAKDRREPAPEELEDVGVDEKLDTQLPLDLTFKNSQGRVVKIADYLNDRPVIFSLNYSDCPMLCNLQLNGLIDGLNELDFVAGQDFDVVSVSIDPNESTKRAAQTKRKYLKFYNHEDAENGWHFLVGSEDNIAALADAIGFRYTFIPHKNEYAHAAVIAITTPQGRISRYMYGVEYPPQTLRLSLVEAAEGKIGTTYDQILLFCFHYNPDERRYGPAARRLMSLGGAVTVVIVLAFLVPTWMFGRPKAVAAGSANAADIKGELARDTSLANTNDSLDSHSSSGGTAP